MNQSRGPTRFRLTLGVWLLALAAVVMPLSGQPMSGQEERPGDPPGALPEGWKEMTDEELEAAGVMGQFQIHDVPYAMLVDGLFNAIVHWEVMHSWWSNHGLDPDSSAVEELRVLANEVERAHPRRIDPESDEQLPEDIEAANARTRARLDQRYRALGVAFGRWLENRRAEGYPPEFFLDRIVAGLGVSAFSSESMESVRANVARNAAEFEVGLRQVMETVPLQLTAPREEVD